MKRTGTMAIEAAEEVSWRRMAGLALGLGLLILVAYANSFSAGLTLDNGVLIGQDPRLRGWDPANLALIFTHTYWWPYLESDLYRPLTTLSYWFNYTVLGNGLNVTGYHAVNFLLHWANAWLVLVIVRRLTGRLGLAALAAALFAVHPVNTESVTNIVGRADLLATGSILFGGWCYMRAAASTGRHRLAWLVAMGAVALVGMLMKESAVMIVAFVLLYDWIWRWPTLPGRTWGERLGAAAREFGLKGYVALVPALGLLAWVRHWTTTTTPVFDQRFVDNPIAHAGAVEGLLTAMKVLGRYLALLVWPGTLSCDYSYNQIPLYGQGGLWEDAQSWLALAAVAALLWAATRWRRSNPTFAWGVWFFFLMLLPTANIVMPIGSIMAERFLYLPSVGFCVVAAQGLLWIGGMLKRRMTGTARWQTTVAWVLPVVVVAGFGARAYARNADWQTELTLWKSAVAAAPNSFKTHKGYANALWDSAQTETALNAALAEEAAAFAILEQKPLTDEQRDNTLYQDMGLYYRLKGVLLAQRGQAAQAQQFYQKAVDILKQAQDVDHWVNQAAREKALGNGHAPDEIRDVGNHRVYQQLGLAQMAAGDFAGAEASGLYMMHLAPQEPLGYQIAGAAAFDQHQPAQAAVLFFESLVLDPKNAEAWGDLQRSFAALGEPAGVTQDGGSFKLNGASLKVHQVMNTAFMMLVQQFVNAKRPDDAQRIRDLATGTYHVPPEVFTQPAK
jgi:tetratricopeptide (TPR) repeat protein